MMTYVMILYFAIYQKGAIATQEFGNEQSCKDAKAAIEQTLRKEHWFDNYTFIVCVPK
jgi:hypothetical protein